MKKAVLAVALSMLTFLAGCGKSENAQAPETPAAQASAPPSAPLPFDAADAAAVKGKVTFKGAVPAPRELPVKGNPECSVFHTTPLYSEELLVKDGAVRNAFVYVKEGLEGRSFPVPAEPVVFENRACVYVPHVMGAQTGQSVVLLNNDPTLHNIHALPKANKPFNLGLPFQGMKQTRKFETPEVMVPFKCDVHPWMTGYLGVLPHPYFAVTGEDGSFELKGLPPGTYTVEVWHEKLGTRSIKVEVGPREAKEVAFEFPA